MAMRSLFRRIPGSVLRSGSGMRSGNALSPAAASRFMGSGSQDIPIPKNIAEGEVLAAKTRESRKVMREAMKVLGEDFDIAMKKANEEVLFTKEYVRREGDKLARSLENLQKVGEACVAAVIASPLLMITWINCRA
ncbi:hypothetical protein EJB05_02940 [Eragrostis curvula]|uniref:Uncharacterized protein n=1 Tax=Eragrostis curvula TaxID=38414 RepID=A0A5J9WTS0_9POAL|nr:hypothetical protein EJB05_02940 [Eragrostis curvula]